MAREVHIHMVAASPPCWTCGRGGRFMSAALPRLLDLWTKISYRWDTGGDGHRRIMAKHGVGGEPPF